MEMGCVLAPCRVYESITRDFIAGEVTPRKLDHELVEAVRMGPIHATRIENLDG
jgi:hypothetical protein